MTAIVWLVATAIGLLRFGYKFLDLRLAGASVPAVVPLVEELTAAYGATLLLVGCVPLLRKLQRSKPGVLVVAGTHVALALAFSVGHTSVNWLSRSIVFALLGRRYSYGAMPARYAMELPMDVIVYVLFAVGLYVVDRLRRTRLDELEAAQLRGKLLEAELRNLRSQLEPHFLFNALNAISETMYENPLSADEMIGHLSELLRASLDSSGTQQVPLPRELADLEHYLALLRARFTGRLQVQVIVDGALTEALVPYMILQPLVENAVRHGASGAETLRVMVHCVREGDNLVIDVDDNGRGLRPGVDPFAGGIGLGATRDRLRLLYGDRCCVEAGGMSDGGFRVHLALPLVPGDRGQREPRSA
jgi:hypothetical protein